MEEIHSRRSTPKHEWTNDQQQRVLARHAELKCGVARLAREFPDIDKRVIVAMFDRLNLGASNYYQWTEEAEGELIRRHLETGWSGARLAREFPGARPSNINTKLSELRRKQRLPRKPRKPRVIYTSEQHTRFRAFVADNRFTYRLPELTERWNVIARQLGCPDVSLEMVRYAARRKLKKLRREQPTPEGAFVKADRDRKLKRSTKRAREIEAEAAKLHQAAKDQAALLLAQFPKSSKEHCRWCTTDFPFTEQFFKRKKNELEAGTCIWCRDRHRRELHRATVAGPAALALHKKRMKAEKRARFYDHRWNLIKAKHLAERDRLRTLKRPPKEQVCIECSDTFPLQEPFFKAPKDPDGSFDRICCFCQHDYRTKLRRAAADNASAERIRLERRSLLLRANRELREAKKAALLRMARSSRGERAPCPNCEIPWPIHPVEKFWRVEGANRRGCLPCAWEYDAERNARGRKRKRKKPS